MVKQRDSSRSGGKTRGRPWSVRLLIISLAFLAFGGLFGGIFMLVDPSGTSLGMDDVLEALPVADYTLPGVFLVVVMGVCPLLLAYRLYARDRSPGRQPPTPDWLLRAVLGLGIVLVGWLIWQGVLIGFRWPIQYVTAVNAVLIIGLGLLPGVKRKSARHERSA